MAPQAVDPGGEAAGVEGAGGEAGFEVVEFGEGAEVAGDLEVGGGAGQEGAVHVEDVQVCHMGEVWPMGGPGRESFRGSVV
ncbi:hypothetical protein LUX33_04135 [Actinomadura madurae]|uniref:hypothetical protein n=1 Tax=Actinomadura madurae TaxID=1993 RepID=UPI0020D1FD13|nr:hypothetical protein [Actinomadura madurae]MCP9947706.1 hypothetical protein [Actinomadura madurae]MCP9964476.1 hypothetical protein [Actinomadura madurae]